MRAADGGSSLTDGKAQASSYEVASSCQAYIARSRGKRAKRGITERKRRYPATKDAAYDGYTSSVSRQAAATFP